MFRARADRPEQHADAPIVDASMLSFQFGLSQNSYAFNAKPSSSARTSSRFLHLNNDRVVSLESLSCGRKSHMIRPTSLRMLLLGSLMSFALLIGCKTDQQKALEQAQSQAATTKAPQQVQYVDKNGNTVTTIVQPPKSGQP